MANGDETNYQSDSSGATPLPTTGAATIDAPEFNKAGTALDLDAKSIKDVGQAWQICKTLEQNRRQRNLRTAEIQEIYDGAPPRSPATRPRKPSPGIERIDPMARRHRGPAVAAVC